MNIDLENHLISKIEEALDEIRPHLRVDGGDIEVVSVSSDNVLTVRWLGNCEACNMSGMTMKGGVEQVIRQRVPEIKSIEIENAFAG